MTKQEILNKLREKRNEMFPPVLEFGSELIDGGGFLITYFEDNIFTYQHIKEDIDADDAHSWIDSGDIKLLGKPLSLQDILLMLERAYENTDYEMECGMGRGVIGFSFSTEEDYHDFDIDLTLSIQDQSEETLDKIYQLVK